MSIRTMIVDDEPLARKRIRFLLEQEDDIHVVAECGSASEAVSTAQRVSPDLLFLDVAIAGGNGIEVIRDLGPETVPAVVFVTGHREHAIAAFDVHATDFLLKPLDDRRFRAAVEAARERIHGHKNGSMDAGLKRLIDSVDHRSKFIQRLAVKSSGRVIFLDVDKIDWIDAAGNYVRLNADGESHLLRETMSNIEKKLDPEKFLRIHRSTIVQVDRIREIHPQSHGEYLVVLDGGKRLTVSRARREQIAALIR